MTSYTANSLPWDQALDGVQRWRFCQNSVHKVKSEPNSAVNIDAFVLKTLTSDANFKAKNRAER